MALQYPIDTKLPVSAGMAGNKRRDSLQLKQLSFLRVPGCKYLLPISIWQVYNKYRVLPGGRKKNGRYDIRLGRKYNGC